MNWPVKEFVFEIIQFAVHTLSNLKHPTVTHQAGMASIFRQITMHFWTNFPTKLVVSYGTIRLRTEKLRDINLLKWRK